MAANSGPFRVGAVVTESPISGCLISTARSALKATTSNADRALSRGYFHATNDTPRARMAFCDAIVDAKMAAFLVDMRWNHALERPGASRSEEMRAGGLHPLVNLLATLSVFDADYDFLHIEIARREGSFSDAHGQKLAKIANEERLGAVIYGGFSNFASRFPGYTVTVADSQDSPGLQVCDLLLWTVQRAELKQDAELRDRVGLRPMMDTTSEQPQGKGQWMLGSPPQRIFMPMGPPPQPVAKMELNELYRRMIELESGVREAHEQALAGNRRIRQHLPRLQEAAKVLDGRRNAGYVAEVAKAYILSCDTLPLYKPSDPEQVTHANENRMVAAFLANDRQLNSGRARDLWSTWLYRRRQGGELG